MAKKVNTDTKLAGNGIRYSPNFISPDDDFEDLTNPEVRLKNLKNVHASPSRITRPRDDGKSSKGKKKIIVTDEEDALVPPKKIRKRNRSNEGEDDAQSSKKKSKKVPWKRKISKLTDFEVWDLFLGSSDHYKCQLSVHTNCAIMTTLKSKLNKKQLHLFKNSCFRYFLSLPNIFPQNQLIHGMLLRELICERDDEIWIKVNNTRLRFDLQEFAIISGLKCTRNYNNEFVVSEESKLTELYFSENSKVTKLDLEECFMKKKWRCDEDALQISALFFIYSFIFSITYSYVITKNDFLLVESGNYETFPWGKLCFRMMLELMKSKVYQRKTMYHFAGFPLAFQCWFYECCPYADGHLADRVGDGVPRILNWFEKYRPTYKEVKSAFFNITQEQVVLRNITSTVLEKTILQLPDFKPVDAVVHSVDLPSTNKQECSQSSSDNELALLRSDVKMDLTEKVSSMGKFMKSSFELIFQALDIKNEPKVGISIGDNDGDNSNEKNDETPNVGGTGDDQVNDPPNVGQQNDVVPKVDHISDNLMDDVGKATDCVGGGIIGHLVDAVGEKVNFIGDCVGGHVDVDSAAETFLKFTQSSGENKDIGEDRNSQVDSDWSNFTDSEVSKFTQPFRDQKTQKEDDVAVVSKNELDWLEISDAEISKFTQSDKSVATTDMTDLVCDNVIKVDATTSDNVKGIEEKIVVAPVMLDETLVIIADYISQRQYVNLHFCQNLILVVAKLKANHLSV
ncbi:hypothetical protein P3S67_003539 [Capsicum chacoense]